MSALRRILPLLLTTAAAVAVPVAVAAPASADISARVSGTGGVGLNVRSAASTTAALRTTVAEGTTVAVSCQTFGTAVLGTTVWDYLPAYGGYASDAYVLTGYDGRHPQLPLCGSTPPPATDLRSRIVSIASAEIGNGHLAKYGNDPSWEWCSSFATWVWRQAGVNIPNYAFTGDVFTWGQPLGRSFWGTDGIRPGDVVLYGTGPARPETSTHIGVVVEVRADRSLVTVEGNFAGAVTRVGPRFPWTDSGWGSVYGYVRPTG